MAEKTLRNIFKNFASFWKTYQGFSVQKTISLPKDRVNEMYVAKGFFNYYLDWPHWNNADSFVPAFCTIISNCTVEIIQKESISNAIYNKFLLKSANIWKVKTTTRRDVSEYPHTDIEEPQPVLALEDLLEKAYGGFSHADWVRRVMRKGERKSQEGIKVRKIKRDADGKPIYQTITETIDSKQVSRQVPVYEITSDNKPVYELQGNYQETENREAIAKLLRCFELFQLNLTSFYERARHLFNPYSFPPPGHYVYDYETGKKKWVPESQLEEETTEEGIPINKKTDQDDLTEEEYNALPTDQKEPTYKLERLKRFRLRLIEAVKRSGGMTKTLEEDRLKKCERLIEIARAAPVKVTKQGFLDYVYNVEKVVGFEEFINEIAADLEFTAHLESIGAKPPRVFYYVLVGPPGVGKSMISGIIARALKKHYGKIGLGGQANPSLLYGAPPTFKAANFGKVLQILTDKRNKDESCVILIDEFEKAKDPSLLDVVSNMLDPEFNKEFYDILLEFDIDISRAWFILTGNKWELVPKFVQERCKKVYLKLYTYKQRTDIARNKLVKLLKDWKHEGLNAKISDKLLQLCITEEWGVRNTVENVEVLARRLVSLEVNNDLPADLGNYKLDDSDKEIRRITYEGGTLTGSREIVLVKEQDKDEHGKTVLTEVSDWPKPNS